MSLVNTHEAKTHLSRLLEEVIKGREVVIAKAGKPVARLVPFRKPPRVRRQPGLARGRVTDLFFEPLPDGEIKAWES